jgi:trk system potassium uptake protein TrkH
LSFLLVIIAGTLLLLTSAASASGEGIGFIDAMFTATSAVCVTGLVVVDTGTQLTLFGQIVVISLIQVGGLGLMTMSTLVFLLMGKRITLRERLIMQEALNQFNLEGVVRLTKNVLIVTFAIESIGALLLSLRFIPLFGWGTGIYYSIFHSISAFCNAGFDLMGHYSSLVSYTGDFIINVAIMGLILFGGLGFSVILDLYRHGLHFRKWSLQTRLVVAVSTALILGGALFIFIVEYNNPETLGHRPMNEKILGSLFQSVSTRTAGFNSVSISGLTNASKFLMVILMFIGASPASTGGGIKTTTFSLILLTAYSIVRGQGDIVVFRRRIPHALATRALAISLISLLVLIGVTMALSLAEFVPFLDLMFQTASALGTVGLASVDTGGMQDVSKILLALTMFMGRVGPLTLTLAFARRQSQTGGGIHYPEERIMVG